jgi:demethylmenaquinone methyltransferase/2-methoxy-6-polyprenyl-1,4-benzoquinol methylase
MSFVLMKILESAPHRYDRGIKILTLGRINKVYDSLCEEIKPGDNVLDIGCGTGMLSLRAVLKGAHVTGIDINPEMLDIAHQRANELKAEDRVTFIEMGIAELDSFEQGSFNVIMSGLCFSELSDDEIMFSLQQIERILNSDGVFLLVDEIKSRSTVKRVINWFIRIPLILITYILTQTTTKAVKDIEQKISESGLEIKSRKTNFLDNFAQYIIIKR